MILATHQQADTALDVLDSRYAWWRMFISLVVATIGGVGLWSVVVVLPHIEAEFGVARADASLPYTVNMIGFAAGAIIAGRLADRFGIVLPLVVASLTLGTGYIAAAYATSLLQFAVIQGVLIGMLGSAVTFGPMLADISLWFKRRRGIAVAIVAAGNYLAGTIWPPTIVYFTELYGWREAYMGVGIFCLCTMLPLSMLFRRRSPLVSAPANGTVQPAELMPNPGVAPNTLMLLLMIAGVACCVAMSMPQVHIVAYCVDLGFGATRGAEMLALMLACGIVSRLASGMIADKLGGVPTLLIGSTLQCLALFFFLPFDSMLSLYAVSALFGLAQGGIVPSYAIIVREYFPPREAGGRVGLVLMATILGMALGGWLSGWIYDLTGSYEAAFLNGIGWNLLNMSIAFWLLMRRRTSSPAMA